LRKRSFSSTGTLRCIPSCGRECHCSAASAWQGTCSADRRQNGLEPANCGAPASLRGCDIFGSSQRFEAGSGESVFVACRLIHIAYCLATGLSGSQRIYTCIQAVVGQNASRSACSKIGGGYSRNCAAGLKIQQERKFFSSLAYF